jgi:hypothetical protein
MHKLIIFLTLFSVNSFALGSLNERIDMSMKETISDMESTQDLAARKKRLDIFAGQIESEIQLNSGNEDLSEDSIRLYQVLDSVTLISRQNCKTATTSLSLKCANKTLEGQDKLDFEVSRKLLKLVCVENGKLDFTVELCKN